MGRMNDMPMQHNRAAVLRMRLVQTHAISSIFLGLAREQELRNVMPPILRCAHQWSIPAAIFGIHETAASAPDHGAHCPQAAGHACVVQWQSPAQVPFQDIGTSVH